MEMKSPPPCPNTVTVRRNPPRRARPTPFSSAPLSLPPSSKTSSAIRSFPIQDILSIDIPDKQEISVSSSPKEPSDSDKLKVFVRIRPIVTAHKSVKIGAQKNVWPQNPNRKKDASKMVKAAGKKNGEICVKVNDSHSVTLCPPQSLADVRRAKSEVYEGFSHVFGAESSQNEVYERMVNPLVVDLLKGKSGMLAAMGPSGSGKTHTVFGSNRDPGMVSLALCQIFSEKESSRSKISRTFYLSMFEIYSEGGKGEKIMDLSPEGSDLFMQQSNIKGLQEVAIYDVQQAESLIANGMLKRSTAMTNSNIQSSRSQCILNIRCKNDDLDEAQSWTATLTIADLAGAEREKRTGNQGARLLESNFINNTSMVFGLCLRSLLEHQKNPKKPFHKHFQNSMLTKYLRDYLEGKKKMALILTVKPGDEDYQDASYLLRQASPFMNIKFENVEEQIANAFGNKRRTQTIPKGEQSKRLKLNNNEVCLDGGVNGGVLRQPHKEVLKAVSTELNSEQEKDVKTNDSSFECPVIINREPNKNICIKEKIIDSAKKGREHQILLNFSRALWKVLKEYKNKLEASENEVNSLKHSLFVEKERCVALETELNLMKISCSIEKEVAAKVPVVEENTIQETSSVTLFSDCSDMLNLENQVSCEYVMFDKDDLMELGDTEFDNEIADCDTLQSVVSDSELLVHGDEVSTFVNKDQRTHEEEEEVNISSPNVVSDKQESKEAEERETNGEITGCDNLMSAVSNSEFIMDEENISSSVKGGQQQHEEEDDTLSNPQVPSSNYSKLELFEKQGLSIEEVESISSDFEKFEEQSNKEVDIPSPNVVSDKQEFKEIEEREAICETTANQDSEFPGLVGDEISFTLNEDQLEHEEKEGDQQHEEEDSNLQVSSSNYSKLELFEKQGNLNEIGLSNVEVKSISSDFEKFEEQSNKTGQEVDIPSPNVLSEIQEFKEIEEREANGETTVNPDSEFPCVVGDEISSTLNEDQLKHEEKEGDQQHEEEDSNLQVSSSNYSKLELFEKQGNLNETGLSNVEVKSISSDFEKFEEQSNNTVQEVDIPSPNVLSEIQEFKEIEEREANGETTVNPDSEFPCVVGNEISSTLNEDQLEHEGKEVSIPNSSSDPQGSKCVGKTELIDFTEPSDQQLPEAPSVKTCQPSSAVKPKRRLRPASSVMLRNINISDFDDATEKPKQRYGKRGENEDGSKKTQGSITLLRILQQNLRH